MNRLGIDPTLLIFRIITLLISFSFHEFSHAFMADKFGDPTPRQDGRLTLNPVRHLDVVGSIMLIVTGFGWAKPVRINPAVIERKSKAGLMVVSFSGPFSNLLLAVIGGLLFRWMQAESFFQTSQTLYFFGTFLVQFIYINLSLMVFNLLPFAPLDGHEVFGFFIPQRFKPLWDSFQNYGMMILLIGFLILPYFRIHIFSSILSPIVAGLFRLITGGN